ncbi:MAG: KTSC domain-containing protein [Proteobacteria bacterium]|nr:KTSC domain-containing protein [Pseudomonadota bacterium]
MDFPRSSVIKSADYDPDAHTLDVMFRSGRHYTYFDVPEQIFDFLIVAPSAGEYFNTQIRDQYASREHR